MESPTYEEALANKKQDEECHQGKKQDEECDPGHESEKVEVCKLAVYTVYVAICKAKRRV